MGKGVCALKLEELGWIEELLILVRASRCKDLVLHFPTQETLETQETAANLVALRVGL